MPGLTQVQSTLGSILPSFCVLVVAKACVQSLGARFVTALARRSETAQALERLTARTARAASVAGKLTASVAFVWAVTTDGSAMLEELQHCRPATVPRGHALAICGLVVQCLICTQGWAIFASFCGLHLCAERSPLALFCAGLALLEWHDVRGLISELIVVSIYASFFSMANDVWKTCGSAHHDAVAIATTVATVGLVRWGTLSLVSLFTKPT